MPDDRDSPCLRGTPRGLDVPVHVEVAFRGFRKGKAGEMVVTVGGDDPVFSVAYDPVDVTASYLAAFEGTYHSAELAADYVLFVREGALLVRGPDRDETVLAPGIEDVFTLGGAVLRFSRNEDGVDGFVLDAGRVQGLRFARR